MSQNQAKRKKSPITPHHINQRKTTKIKKTKTKTYTCPKEKDIKNTMIEKKSYSHFLILHRRHARRLFILSFYFAFYLSVHKTLRTNGLIF